MVDTYYIIHSVSHFVSNNTVFKHVLQVTFYKPILFKYQTFKKISLNDFSSHRNTRKDAEGDRVSIRR